MEKTLFRFYRFVRGHGEFVTWQVKMCELKLMDLAGDCEVDAVVSRKLRLMSAVCSFLVVFIHIHVCSCNTGPWIIWAYLSHGIGKIAVPFFFVAAGYLVSGHMGEAGWYKREVSKRVYSLLIPLIVWCLLWFVYSYLLRVVVNFLHGRSLWFGLAIPTVIDIGRFFAVYPFSQPYLGVLWFVRTLFVLVLFSPLLKRLANPYGIVVLMLLNGVVHPDYGVACTPLIFTFQEGFLSDLV